MNHLSSHSREFTFVGVLLASIILLVTSLLLIDEYASVLDDQVAIRVESNSTAVLDCVTERLQTFKDKATYAAGKIQCYSDPTEFALEIKNLASDVELRSTKFVAYYQGDAYYAADGSRMENVPQIDEMIALGGGVSKLFVSEFETMGMFAFGAPVSGNKNIDFVVLYYTQDILAKSVAAILTDEVARERIDPATLALVVDENGRVLEKIKDVNSWINGAPYVNDIFNERLDDEQIILDLMENARNGRNGCVKTSINSESFTVGVARSSAMNGFYIVTLYNASDAYSTGYSFITVISATVAILFIIMIIFTVYMIISRAKVNKLMREYGTVDNQLGCPTLIGMERIVPQVAAQFPGSTFALSVVEIKHFNYIRDTYGQEVADATLTSIYKTLKRSLDRAEIVGYLGDNQFVLLTHFKTSSALVNRLRLISSLISDPLNAKKYNIKILFGVCELEKDKDGKVDVRKTISCCSIAMNSVTENSVANNVIFFNDVLKEAYMQNADIETKMESALSAGEFRVFYQPKVDLHNGHLAGSEALIRWYDSERDYYRPPDTFLPLFEENGFIVKLDKFVYQTVCKFIADRVNAGLKVYPISVNISRLTALDPDFLDFYIKIKKKYGIANKMVILEFTENIAHESYELLSRLIDTLHRNGFLCSIDDFGSGYASFNLLKSLPMDEIKLDRVFLDKGFSAETDRRVWEAVIKLGQSLDLTVVQEGVETEEIAKYLTDIGCDVIQGYYYSRPITTEDFIHFLTKCEEQEREELESKKMASRLGLDA